MIAALLWWSCTATVVVQDRGAEPGTDPPEIPDTDDTHETPSSPVVRCGPAAPVLALGGARTQGFGELEVIGGDLLLSGDASVSQEFGPTPQEPAVALTASCSAARGNGWLARVTTSGTVVWARVLHSCSTTRIEDVAPGPHGDVFFVGSFDGPTVVRDERGTEVVTLPLDYPNVSTPLVGKLHPDATLHWTVRTHPDLILAWPVIAADPDASGVVVVGTIGFTSGDIVLTWGDDSQVTIPRPASVERGLLVARFEADGDLAWAHLVSDAADPDYEVHTADLAIASDGRIELTFRSSSTALLLDGMVQLGPGGDTGAYQGGVLAFDRLGAVVDLRFDGSVDGGEVAYPSALETGDAGVVAECGLAGTDAAFDVTGDAPVASGSSGFLWYCGRHESELRPAMVAPVARDGSVGANDLATSDDVLALAASIQPPAKGWDLELPEGTVRVERRGSQAAGVFVVDPAGALVCFSTLETEHYLNAYDGIAWQGDSVYAVGRWQDEVVFPDGTHWTTTTPDGYGDGVLVRIPVTLDLGR